MSKKSARKKALKLLEEMLAHSDGQLARNQTIMGDGLIGEVLREYGYPTVMHSASRLWRKRATSPGSPNFNENEVLLVGPNIHTVRAIIAESKEE